MICNPNAEVANEVLSPDDHIPLLEMKYGPILTKTFATWGGINYFAPEVNFLSLVGDLRFAQSLRIRWEKEENIFDQVEVTDVKYDDDANCPPKIDFECTPGCIGTVPSWCDAEIRFDKFYRVGAQWCVYTEHVTYGTLDERMSKSLKAQQQVQSINAWNYLICESVANPAETLNPIDRGCFPVHYIEGGSAAANAYALLGQVIAYMKSVFGGMTDFGIFAYRYFEQDIISADSSVHNYSNTGIPTDWGTKTALVQGGFRPMAPFGGKLWGETVFIAPDTLDLYGNGKNRNPFISEDGTKYYVVIASKRAFLTGVQDYGKMHHYPATCDNKIESLEKVFIGYNYILRPEEVFVLAFDLDCNPVVEGPQAGTPAAEAPQAGPAA